MVGAVWSRACTVCDCRQEGRISAAKKRRREDEICVQNLDIALATAAESVPLDAICNRPNVAPDGPSQLQDIHSSMSGQPGSAQAYLNGGWMQDLDIVFKALGKN